MNSVWVLVYTTPHGRRTHRVWNGAEPDGVGQVLVERVWHDRDGSVVLVRYSRHGRWYKRRVRTDSQIVGTVRAIREWRT